MRKLMRGRRRCDRPAGGPCNTVAGSGNDVSAAGHAVNQDGRLRQEIGRLSASSRKTHSGVTKHALRQLRRMLQPFSLRRTSPYGRPGRDRASLRRSVVSRPGRSLPRLLQGSAVLSLP